MTSPVPDALRTQLAEDRVAIAEALNKAGYGPVFADGPFIGVVADLLAAARAEGAAEELFRAANSVESLGIQAKTRTELACRPGLFNASDVLRARAAALSAPTTTEGDPT